MHKRKRISTVMMPSFIVLLLVVALLVALPTRTASFQSIHATTGSLRNAMNDGCAMASTRSDRSGLFANTFSSNIESISGDGLSPSMIFDDNSDIMIPESSSCRDKKKQQPFTTFLLSVALCCLGCCNSQQLANAAVLPETTTTATTNTVQQSHYLTTSSSSTTSPTTTPSSLLLASYASEGSGGLPFLSTFQTPGAVPNINPKSNDKEARNRAFDEAFDQDKRDRDAYYAKMALASREKKMLELQARRAEIGLDAIDAGPRVGDKDVASMASLKQYLQQMDPATMTPAEFKEFQALQLQQQQRPEQLSSPEQKGF